MKQLIVILLAIGTQTVFQYFAFVASKSNELALLGWSPSHALPQSLVITLKWLWILIIANILFSYAAKVGFGTFDSFLTYILIFAAASPIASLILNALTDKVSINVMHLAGILLIIAGSALIVGNKEVMSFLK